MIGEARIQTNHKSCEWYTPKFIFDLLQMQFDLDPCSPHDMESFVPATTKYTIFDDGLSKKWAGEVWLNPPYGRKTGFWMKRMVSHGQGIALVFSRTDTKWCQLAMKKCDCMLFIEGRFDFVPGKENKHKKSRCGAGTVLFAFGGKASIALAKMGHLGTFIGMGIKSK